MPESPETATDSEPQSPAERYADYRSGRAYPVFRDFTAHYVFPLDEFQVRALDALP